MHTATHLLIAAALLPLSHSIASTDAPWTPAILTDPAVREKNYLPDFSFAGYHWGEAPLPDLKPTLDVTDFGAIPDDKIDDTAALKKALAAAHAVKGPVVLRFPLGRFILTGILNIQRSDIVLQGSGIGPNGTTIYMPKPLGELPRPDQLAELDEYLLANDKRQIEPERGIDKLFSRYAWTGGFIWINTPTGRPKKYLEKYNTEPEVQLAKVTRGRRGEFTLEVEDSSQLKVGQLVRINWFNREGEKSSLIAHLYDNQPVTVGLRHWENPARPLITQEVTLTAINGRTIILKQPLLHDLRTEWTPTITAWEHLTEVGIENIRFEFAFDEYYAHHLEKGFNAIYLGNTAHSWMRNLEFINADSGVITDSVANTTITDIRCAGRKSHYTVHCGEVYGLLIKNLHVSNESWHSLSFNTLSRGSVYTGCTVTRAPALDQHSGANHQNLFDNITVYEDDPEHSMIYSGGTGYWAPTHGAFSTFWNIKAHFIYPLAPGQTTIKVRGVLDGASSRIIGMHGNYPIDLEWKHGPYIEGLNRPNLAVPSLYDYQLKRRLS